MNTLTNFEDRFLNLQLRNRKASDKLGSSLNEISSFENNACDEKYVAPEINLKASVVKLDE